MNRETRFLAAAWVLALGLMLGGTVGSSGLALAGVNALCLLTGFLLCLMSARTRIFAPLRRMRRPNLLAAMIILVAIAEELTRSGQTPVAYPVAASAIGPLLWAFWLRGPDGEPHALWLSTAGALCFVGLAMLIPASQSWAVLASGACGTLALLHLAALRTRPLPWASPFTQRRPRLPSRLS